MKIHGVGRDEFLRKAGRGEVLPVYLFIGDGPVITPLVNKLLDILLPSQAREMNLEVIPRESYSDGAVIEALGTMPFFGQRKVVLLRDPPFLAASKGKAGVRGKSSSGKAQGVDSAGSGEQTLLSRLKKGLDPRRFVLVIQTCTADRRSRAYKQLAALGAVTDLEVKASDRRGARDAFREVARKWVSSAGKAISPQALEFLFARVGQDFYSLETEISKLLSGIGDRDTIELADVERLVATGRDHELYELTGAIDKKDLKSCVMEFRHLLAQGVHPIAVFQIVASYIQRLILVKDALEGIKGALPPGSVSYQAFQKNLLPSMKRYWGDPPPSVLKGIHPYVVYKMFQTAGSFDKSFLFSVLQDMVETDLALKGGSRAADMVLESLILRIVHG